MEFLHSFAACLDDFLHLAMTGLSNLMDPLAFQRAFANYHLDYPDEHSGYSLKSSYPLCLVLQTILTEISAYFNQPNMSLIGTSNISETDLDWADLEHNWINLQLDEHAFLVMEVTGV